MFLILPFSPQFFNFIFFIFSITFYHIIPPVLDAWHIFR